MHNKKKTEHSKARWLVLAGFVLFFGRIVDFVGTIDDVVTTWKWVASMVKFLKEIPELIFVLGALGIIVFVYWEAIIARIKKIRHKDTPTTEPDMQSYRVAITHIQKNTTWGKRLERGKILDKMCSLARDGSLGWWGFCKHSWSEQASTFLTPIPGELFPNPNWDEIPDPRGRKETVIIDDRKQKEAEERDELVALLGGQQVDTYFDPQVSMKEIREHFDD